MFRRPLLILALLAGMFICPQAARCASIGTWLYCYGSDLRPSEYGRFDLVVLDAAEHPRLVHGAAGKPLLLGSISVGELHAGDPAWGLVQGQDFIAGGMDGGQPPRLDLRSGKWQSLLLETVIPQVLAQGFDGVLLDTIDAALAQEPGTAERNARRAGVISFLRKARAQYPGVHIAMNSGLELMPDAAPFIDSLLVEDLSYAYDFGTKQYRAVSPAARTVLVAAVRRAQAANPKLMVLTLDYVEPDQTAKIEEAIRYSRSKGFVPYVGTRKLDQVFTHTLKR